MNTLARYFHTLRHLRPVQILGRARQRFHRPRPDPRPAPAVRNFRGRYAPPCELAPSMLAPDSFRFLSVDGRLGSAADWNAPGRALLWTYHLHYFDDLNAAGARLHDDWHRQLIERWIAENPPGRGAGWEPYPLSRRIVNWIKWTLSGGTLPQAARASLAVQMRWLAQCVEYHLLGNHLFTNAKALVHAGLYFEGAEAARLLARGLRIVDTQLREQILADGGHIERSTMYHAAALDDLLDLVNLLRAARHALPESWPATAARMYHWLSAMTHPDGEISFFNDAAFGVVPTAAMLAAYAQRLEIDTPTVGQNSLVVLRDSGYARLASASLTLIADCAAIGPDYLPGHAHADTLSFELSVGAQRVFVNSGTSEYGLGAERSRQRGTAAHNTVVIEGADSSEVWAGFRVARRAHARLLAAGSAPQLALEGSHDGYRRLRGRNVHSRRWILEERALRIEDRVSGAAAPAEAYFHLHPAVRATHEDAATIALELPDRQHGRLRFAGASVVELRGGTWHPQFGATLANQHVAARLDGAQLTTHFTLD